MARVLAVDYGTKRVGIAVTDPLQIIAAPLVTVAREDLFQFLDDYIADEDVSTIVVGEPLHADGTPSDNHSEVMSFVQMISKRFPSVDIALQDEYQSSLAARDIILRSVPKKMKRRDKSLVDKVSAAIILQRYLGH